MKLLDQIRGVLRAKHYAYRTEQCYVHWIIRYIRFQGVKHPNTMGTSEIEQFLTHLATHDKVAASTQNQALGALLFLYRDVLKFEVGDLNAVRARRPVRIPTVMTRDEAAIAHGSRRT